MNGIEKVKLNLVFRESQIIVFAILCLAISGCGGGGGGGDETPQPVEPPVAVNQPPQADAGSDRAVSEQSSVTITGTASDSDGSIVSYQWTQTSGTSVSLNGSDTSSATFMAPTRTEPEDLYFTFTVTDDDGATASDTLVITVTPVNTAPTANAGSNSSVWEQSEFTLTGSGSDTDGEIVTYRWRQTSGNVNLDISSPNSAETSVTVPNLSQRVTVTFELEVTDNEGSYATDTVQIVANARLSLNQAAAVTGTPNYEYGHRSIPNMEVTGVPADADWSRWAMYGAGSNQTFLFMMAEDSNNRVYQFGYNPQTQKYEWGHNSAGELNITNVPSDVDGGIAATYVEESGVLYIFMKKESEPTTMYYFVYEPNSGDISFRGELYITGVPADADWDRWAMLHDGSFYRLYVSKANSNSILYQSAYNPSSGNWEYGYRSYPEIYILGMPTNSDTRSFKMLHDSVDYRFYHQADN
ncbi:PKD domain-containing protein [Aliikangiella sp. IMCC44632]